MHPVHVVALHSISAPPYDLATAWLPWPCKPATQDPARGDQRNTTLAWPRAASRAWMLDGMECDTGRCETTRELRRLLSQALSPRRWQSGRNECQVVGYVVGGCPRGAQILLLHRDLSSMIIQPVSTIRCLDLSGGHVWLLVDHVEARVTGDSPRRGLSCSNSPVSSIIWKTRTSVTSYHLIGRLPDLYRIRSFI